MALTKRALLLLAISGGLLVGGQAAIASAGAAQTVNVAPASPTSIDNCFPFGQGVVWPYMGFVYKNVPAFQLKAGDSLAFDLGVMNDADVHLDIELAATTTNGGDVPQAFTKVVNNTQTPANPRGDTTSGNFELSFTAQAPFNFAGGGLIMRFSNPSAAYATDTTCTANLVGTSSTDTSGFFVKRFFDDSDGLPPYPSQDGTDIGGFRLTLLDIPPAPPTPTPPAGSGTTVPKKKCKKHKKKHRAASAKKHCKKKK